MSRSPKRVALFHGGEPEMITDEVLIGDLSLLDDRLLLDETRMLWNGQDLSAFDRVLIHGFKYATPVIPDAAPQRDWSLWRDDYLAEQQSFSALFSFIVELKRRGVTVINSGSLDGQPSQICPAGWLPQAWSQSA